MHCSKQPSRHKLQLPVEYPLPNLAIRNSLVIKHSKILDLVVYLPQEVFRYPLLVAM